VSPIQRPMSVKSVAAKIEGGPPSEPRSSIVATPVQPVAIPSSRPEGGFNSVEQYQEKVMQSDQTSVPPVSMPRPQDTPPAIVEPPRQDLAAPTTDGVAPTPRTNTPVDPPSRVPSYVSGDDSKMLATTAPLTISKIQSLESRAGKDDQTAEGEVNKPSLPVLEQGRPLSLELGI
jgi:hypothetical protein